MDTSNWEARGSDVHQFTLLKNGTPFAAFNCAGEDPGGPDRERICPDTGEDP